MKALRLIQSRVHHHRVIGKLSTSPHIRTFSASAMVKGDPFKPAQRVAGQRQDVWSIVNEAAQASSVQPMVNMGQGFFGYNPPQFVVDAAKEALDKVECNQYSPTKVCILKIHAKGINHRLTWMLGTTSIEESDRRRLLTILRPNTEPRHRSHNHNRRQ